MPPAPRKTAEAKASQIRPKNRRRACRSPSLSAMAESCQASRKTAARMVRMVGILQATA